MASIKVHVGKFSDSGTENCDFRGEKFVGAPQGDFHRTILEKDFGPDVNDNPEIQGVLENGPEWNKLTNSLLRGLIPAGIAGGVFGDLTEGVGLRIGVWDE